MFPETALKLLIIVITDFKLTNLMSLKINQPWQPHNLLQICPLPLWVIISSFTVIDTIAVLCTFVTLLHTGWQCGRLFVQNAHYGNNLIKNCKVKNKKKIYFNLIH